jgi:hypothetical protein
VRPQSARLDEASRRLATRVQAAGGQVNKHPLDIVRQADVRATLLISATMPSGFAVNARGWGRLTSDPTRNRWVIPYQSPQWGYQENFSVDNKRRILIDAALAGVHPTKSRSVQRRLRRV